VKGVGQSWRSLAPRGIAKVQDLSSLSSTYEDRRAVRHISLGPDQLVSIKAQIQKIRSIPMGKSKRAFEW